MSIDPYRPHRLPAIAATVMALLVAPVAVQAKNDGLKLTITPVMAKMKPFYASGDLIPAKGSAAVIEVYGNNGKYEGIANLTGKTQQPWRVEAKAPLGNKFLESWIEIDGKKTTVFKNGKPGVRGHAPRVVVTTHSLSSLDIGVDPVRACNSELAMRAAKSGKSRPAVQKRGFVLKVDDALRGRVRMQYLTLYGKATPERPAKAPAYIACLPANLHGKKAQPSPQPRPGFRMKVKMNAVVSVQGGKVSKTNLRGGKCPLQARFEAEVFAPRSMTVRYRYVGNGWQSPVKQKQLKPGRQTLPVHLRWVGKPKQGGIKLKAGAGGPDYTGWAAVEILQTGGNIVSEKENYKVYCSGKAKRRPTRPGTTMPGKITAPAPDPKQPHTRPHIKRLKTLTCKDKAGKDNEELCP